MAAINCIMLLELFAYDFNGPARGFAPTGNMSKEFYPYPIIAIIPLIIIKIQTIFFRVWRLVLLKHHAPMSEPIMMPPHPIAQWIGMSWVKNPAFMRNMV